MRYFIELAYNGKNYHGWQAQPNAHSVQTEIQQKLEILFKFPVEITGCGRTDTGVHASQYFAHMDLNEAIDAGKIAFQLNALLPKDIAVYRIFEVDPNLHARYDAIEREYKYYLCTRPNPFLHELSWLYTKPLDIEAMNAAADIIKSHEDFECFSKVHTDVKTFLCKINYAQWSMEENHMLVFTVRANRFLRNMVRAIVGTLVDVGKGKLSLEDVKTILESKNRSEAGQSVLAQGLFLTKVSY